MDLPIYKEIKNENTYEFVLETKNIELGNILRRAMFHVETWAIEYVIFYNNETERKDEIISLLLGLLPVDNETFIEENDIDENETVLEKMFTINVSAGNHQREITSRDIVGLPFVREHPILVLNKHQSLHCSVVLKKGTGTIHSKWNPACCIRIDQEENEGLVKIIFKTKDMLNPRSIVEKAIQKIPVASAEPPIDIFSKPVIPKEEL
jgi:DNA-directed RNA polymerase alpha subunit